MADVELKSEATFTVVHEASSTSAFVALERAHHENPIFLGGTNTWIVGGTSASSAQQGLAIIDPGFASERHIRQIMSYGTIVAILITHRHLDHSEAANELSRRTGAPIYAGDTSLYDDATLLCDTDVLVVGDAELVAVHTPGHTADSFCFEVRSVPEPGRVQGLLTGDTLLGNNSTPVDTSSGGGWADYLNTLLMLERCDGIEGFPGHGPVIADVAEWSRVQRIRRLDRLREAQSLMQSYDRLSPVGDVVEWLARDMYSGMPEGLRVSVVRNVQSMIAYIENSSLEIEET